MKMIAGAFFLAAANSSLTRLAGVVSPTRSQVQVKPDPLPPTSDSHKHLVETAPAGEEERHLGFSRYGARQHRLARSGRTSEEDALGQLSAEGGELFRVSQKLDELFELLQASCGFYSVFDLGATHRLGLLDTVDIAKLDHATFFRFKFHRTGTSLQQTRVLHHHGQYREDDKHP